jgi:flagellar protein FlaI
MNVLSEKVREITETLSGFSLFGNKEEDFPEENAFGKIIDFEASPREGEIERYWVDKTYAFVSIIRNTGNRSLFYHISEPELDDFEKSLLDEVTLMIGDVLTLNDVSDLDEITVDDKTKLLRDKTNELLSDYPKLSRTSFEKIFYYIRRNYIHFGKINPIMRDPRIEDAWFNGPGIPVYVFHTAYGNLITNVTFENDDDIDTFVMRIAHQSMHHISKSSPILDTVMHDGSRINITYGYEVSPKGTSFSIRKQKEVPITPLDLISWNTFPSEIMAYFWLAMVGGKNILFCGGTATGKTSSMNAICMFIPPNIRIVTLEDTREIQLPHENWIPIVTREGVTTNETGKIDLEDLLKASLRQRPDYLLVGEVRGRESQILFQAMNAGHATCSTFHAGTPKEVINRFTNPPISVPVAMFTALDIISMQSNTYENGAEIRRVSEVAEVVGVSNNVETKTTFIWDPVTDTFSYRGSKVLEEIRNRRGWTPEELRMDLARRKMFLEMLLKKGVRGYQELFDWFDAFNRNPDRAVTELSGYGREEG